MLLLDNKITKRNNPKLVYIGYKLNVIKDEDGNATKNYYRDYRPEYKNTCFCKNCKTIINAKKETFILNERFISFSFTGEVNIDSETKRYIYSCPICGESAFRNDMLYTNKEYVTTRQVYLNDNKIKFVTRTIEYIYGKNENFITKQRHYMIVMNLDTGRSYKFPTMVNGVKTKGERLTQITYKIYHDFLLDYNDTTNLNVKSSDDIIKEAYNMMRDYQMKHLDRYIPSYEQRVETLDTNKMSMGRLLSYNRFPSLSKRLLDFNPYFRNLSDTKDCISSYKFKKLRASLKHESKDIYKDILEFFNIPVNKSYKKFVAEHDMIFIQAYLFAKNHLSIDNIQKIFNRELDYNMNENIVPIIESLVSIIDLSKTSTKTINNLCTKIAKSSNLYDVRDTFFMLHAILKHNPEYKINWKTTLDELHDIVSSDYKKMKQQNIIYNYNESQKELEGIYDDLEFVLAKDSYELIDTGTAMNICVGSYGNSVGRYCYIILAKDINTKETKICIEIETNLFVLRQTKLKHNNHVNADNYKYTVYKWIKDKNLFPINYDLEDHKQYCIENKDILIPKINKIFNKKDSNYYISNYLNDSSISGQVVAEHANNNIF